jgi:hypothetical protein
MDRSARHSNHFNGRISEAFQVQDRRLRHDGKDWLGGMSAGFLIVLMFNSGRGDNSLLDEMRDTPFSFFVHLFGAAFFLLLFIGHSAWTGDGAEPRNQTMNLKDFSGPK